MKLAEISQKNKNKNNLQQQKDTKTEDLRSVFISFVYRRTEIKVLIYTTIIPFTPLWHDLEHDHLGSEKNGTSTKNYSTDTSFTHPFFCHANHCEITFWYGCRAQDFGKSHAGKSWFGSANRLHYKFYRNRVSISGTRTNFTRRARTTFSVGPRTGEILVRHGWN